MRISQEQKTTTRRLDSCCWPSSSPAARAYVFNHRFPDVDTQFFRSRMHDIPNFEGDVLPAVQVNHLVTPREIGIVAIVRVRSLADKRIVQEERHCMRDLFHYVLLQSNGA